MENPKIRGNQKTIKMPLRIEYKYAAQWFDGQQNIGARSIWNMGSSVITVLAIVIFATVLNICYAQVLYSGCCTCCTRCMSTCRLLLLFYFHFQLTFSPNWGKRSNLLGSNSPLLGLNANIGGTGATNNGGGPNPSNAANFNGNGCKTSLDSLMMIYHLIQASLRHYE